MTRNKFLKELSRALEGELPKNERKEQIRYYSRYLKEEAKKGRSKEEVFASLGEPWVIARTILSAGGGRSLRQEKKQKKASGRRKKIFLSVFALVLGIAVVMIMRGILTLLSPVLALAAAGLLIRKMIRQK